jgi:hypothetical protein
LPSADEQRHTLPKCLHKYLPLLVRERFCTYFSV